MNSQTTKDITGFRSYLPDALRLRFDEQLFVRAIAQQLGLSHSTIHNLFQRFNASCIVWPLPESLSFAQLDAMLYANRKKECKRLARTVLIFTESSDQLSRATDRVPGLPASPGYAQ